MLREELKKRIEQIIYEIGIMKNDYHYSQDQIKDANKKLDRLEQLYKDLDY